MKKLVVALLALFPFSALALEQSYIVTVDSDVTEKIQNLNSNFVLESEQIKPDKVLNSINSFVAKLTPEQVQYLKKSGVKIRPDRERHLLGYPDSAPNMDLERNLEYTYGLENIGLIEMRAAHPELTGEKVVVGIIDSGIDPKHPAFSGKEIVFKDFTANKSEPYDDNGHGTHVAGTISGVGSPNFGIAPKVKLVIAKVFSASGSASDSTILAAMEWVQTQGVSVVNNSWGGEQDDTDPDTPYNRMVKSWISKNIFPSFAAGNSGPKEGSMSIPGGYLESFAVGSVDDLDKLSRFSSKGPIVWKGSKYNKPDICAPGSRVYSSTPNGKYAYFSGTSMATPHVTGVVALLKQADPKMNVSSVWNVLTTSAKNVNLKVTECGSGRLDANSAVEMVLSNPKSE
jgi:subtilisin family serine protease